MKLSNRKKVDYKEKFQINLLGVNNQNMTKLQQIQVCATFPAKESFIK